MRYLLLFMLLVAVFVIGKRSCHFDGFGYGVQGAGPTKTETRSVSDFHAIDLDLAGDVEVSVGDYKVEVQAQENILPLLKTTVENGRLRLYFDENVSNTKDIKILVSAPSFDAFSLGGSGEIRVMTPIQSDKMALDISGSGNIIATQSTFSSLQCSVSGSGNVELAGKSNTAQVDVSGSGDVNAKNMEINTLQTNVAGSGAVSAHVVQTLNAEVSGSGEVEYSGSPAVESHVSGSGSVSKL